MNLVKKLINNVTADMLMIHYVYGYIIPISSEFAFRRVQTIPKGQKNHSQSGTQPSQRWEDKLNQPQKRAQRGNN